MRLVEIIDLPRPVGNSLYQGLVFNCFNVTLSYHVETPPDPDPARMRIRVLNTEIDEFLCAAIHVSDIEHVSVQAWDGDEGTGHPLSALGLRMDRFYEVVDESGLKAAGDGSEPPVRRFAFAFRTRVFEIATSSRYYSVTVERRSVIDALNLLLPVKQGTWPDPEDRR